jgi:hypothetical protein
LAIIDRREIVALEVLAGAPAVPAIETPGVRVYAVAKDLPAVAEYLDLLALLRAERPDEIGRELREREIAAKQDCALGRPSKPHRKNGVLAESLTRQGLGRRRRLIVEEVEVERRVEPG